MPRRQPLRLACALLLGAAPGLACHYSYSNPAQSLAAGEISGMVLVEGVAAPGASASVKGSTFTQVTRPTGRFSLLPLASDTYTVLLRQGVDRALQREVTVDFGSDSRPEGVWLGALELPRAVALSGTVDTTGALPGAGLVLDEITGLSGAVGAVSSGGFQLDGLAVGSHRLVAVTRDGAGQQYLAGPVDVDVPPAEEGTNKVLTPLPLRAATTAEGTLTFRVVSLVDGLDAADAQVRYVDAAGAWTTPPAADSTGLRSLSLGEGLYAVEVRPPPAFAASVATAPVAQAIVFAGAVSDAGTLYLVEDGTVDAAQLSCVRSADCGVGAACSPAHVCTGYLPPPAAPASLPLCRDQASAPGVGTCMPSGWPSPGSLPFDGVPDPDLAFTYYCLPCGTSCTTDGVTVLSASACP